MPARASAATAPRRKRPHRPLDLVADRIQLVRAAIAEVGKNHDRNGAGTGTSNGPSRPLWREFKTALPNAGELQWPNIAKRRWGPTDRWKRHDKATRKESPARRAVVVLVVARGNYPLYDGDTTVAPALIAGNAVVLKHATQTPASRTSDSKAFYAAASPTMFSRTLF